MVSLGRGSCGRGEIGKSKEWGPRVRPRVRTSVGFLPPLNGHRGEGKPEGAGELDFSGLLKKR